MGITINTLTEVSITTAIKACAASLLTSYSKLMGLRLKGKIPNWFKSIVTVDGDIASQERAAHIHYISCSFLLYLFFKD